VGDRAAADLGRGEPVALEQHLAGLLDVTHLREAAGDVEHVVGPALGQQAVEALRVDALVHLDRRASLAELDRGGSAVQFDVGRAEAGPVVVVVGAHLGGRLFGAREQVAHGGTVADPGRGHGALEQQHAVDREPFRAALVAATRRQPVGDVDIDLEGRTGPAEREQRAAHPMGGDAGQQRVTGPLGDRDRAVGGEPGQLVLAQLAQGRGGDLVDLPEQVGGGVCVGTTGVRRVRGLCVAQQLGQRPGQHAVFGVLEGEPGVADRLAHLGQRLLVWLRVEERADRVVALQGGPDLLDLDLVDAVDRVRPAFRVLAQQELHVELEDVGDLVDHRELV
jgi:hypothetical protein